MSVARDELDAVGYMYTRFGPLGCQLGFEWDVLKKLAEFSSDSISYFTVSLLVSVLQLMIMSTLPSELANDAEEKMAKAFVFDPGIQLTDIVDAINAVGATPSDLVAILEALKVSGALRAQLIII